MSGSSLFFVVTAAFSIYGLSYYRKNGFLPEYSIHDTEHLPIEEQYFSADTNDKLNNHENMQLNHPDEEETTLAYTNAEEHTHSGEPIVWTLQQPHIAPAELRFEPANNSRNGSGYSYEPSLRPQSRPNFQYSANDSRCDTHPSDKSQLVGGLKPLPMQIGGRPSRQDLAMDFDHGGYASGGQVDFPEGDYGR